ncbi:metal-dependent hydrolase [Nocardia stercoris]|uniref:Metal-dependent hydrolase n=1 Tax=Nocardia stercoris TaxID=2483361 RepID=A0A3M2L6W9_9NOCA|nr:metal-dependent hydrolase [Nocardia stercoris]RMI33277.1 metal-dependent hydrolase [Nocardia stercoris]
MLGHSHATSGALAWSAAAAALPLSVLTFPVLETGHLTTPTTGHLGIAEVLLGTFLTAGAALIPDADHPHGTIAHVLGPLSHAACKAISKISGGHRHATHSFAFVIASGAVTWAGEHYIGRWFTLSLTFFLLALAARALNLCPPGKGVDSYGTIIVLALAGTFVMDQWIEDRPVWLPFCVFLGGLTHLFGDCLTDHGCRLFWPLRIRTSVPLIDHTGNRLETWVLSPLFVLGTLAALWYGFTHHP